MKIESEQVLLENDKGKVIVKRIEGETAHVEWLDKLPDGIFSKFYSRDLQFVIPAFHDSDTQLRAAVEAGLEHRLALRSAAESTQNENAFRAYHEEQETRAKYRLGALELDVTPSWWKSGRGKRNAPVRAAMVGAIPKHHATVSVDIGITWIKVTLLIAEGEDVAAIKAWRDESVGRLAGMQDSVLAMPWEGEARAAIDLVEAAKMAGVIG